MLIAIVFPVSIAGVVCYLEKSKVKKLMTAIVKQRLEKTRLEMLTAAKNQEQMMEFSVNSPAAMQ